MWYDTTPSFLPYALFIPFDEPATLGPQHAHYLGCTRWSRFDSACCVEIGKPRVRFDTGRCAREEGAFGVLGVLVDLGREALFGGHDENI